MSQTSRSVFHLPRLTLRAQPRSWETANEDAASGENKGQLAKTRHLRETRFVPIARDKIEAKVLKWPAAKRIKLAEKLLASVDEFASSEIEAAWNTEIQSRVMEIREGRADAIPAEEVMAEARKKLHDARRLA